MESLRICLFAILFVACLGAPSLAAQSSPAIEMKVRTVAIDPNSQSPVVVLEGISTKDYLPIWIDLPEARAISMELEQVKPPRPLTHDLIRNILSGVGAKVKQVIITDLRNNTYYATIAIVVRGQESEIDSRPSDAIAVALRMKAPIFVASRVMENFQASVAPSALSDLTQQRLGIRIQELTAALAKLMESQADRGVIVTEVIGGSAASKAGLQRGDIISKLDGQPVPTAATLTLMLQDLKQPERINLEIIRKAKPMTITIDLP